MSAFRYSVSPSGSSDDDGWGSSRKSSKKKTSSGNPKKARLESRLSDPEEGEIPSDAFDDDEDDGLDDDLYGGEEDKQRLLKLSEKEREEELYRRSERREAMKIRRDLKKRLKEKKEREKAERANQKCSPVGEPSKDVPLKSTKKSSAYANVYSSDSDQGSSSEVESVKSSLKKRRLELSMQKESRSKRLQELADRRKELKNRKETSNYDSEDERKGSQSRLSSYSRSSSAQSSESSDDDRGRSRSPEVEYITTLEQLSKIRLSRFKLEKWVHIPFFDTVAKGCFVRIHIGLCQGTPVYRCGEIIDVVEMAKPYDLGQTRTNKGIVIRLGRDQHTFRLAVVSNSEFQPIEFESWKKYSSQAGIKPPTTSFVAQKAAEIHKYLTTPISDERVVEQIIQSKRRFQKAPTNFALRKAELLKQRELANENGDTEATKRIDMELDELETQAERIERRRTIGFKAISSINQRNRALSLKQAEEAIMKDARDTANSREEDPFTRIQSTPVIATKSYLERLRNMRNTQSTNNTEKVEGAAEIQEQSKTEAKPENRKVDSPLAASLPPPPEESLHAIHDFEIDINVELDGNSNSTSLDGRSSNVHRPTSNPLVSSHGSPMSNGAVHTKNDKPNRRFLNLQEYKRRRGLI
ncbi:unnamed protein product [Mesocestoides corti]|uniref:Plus3 domain-containing protein n=1 Tax=Mesocestoides corti TaxID=53468 RepID=A0A0R3UMR8_MESCO|nr:unnamed protein product [Mesocestoides corti]